MLPNTGWRSWVLLLHDGHGENVAIVGQHREQSIRGGEYPHRYLNSWIASHNSWKWFIPKQLTLGMKLHEVGAGFQFSHRSRHDIHIQLHYWWPGRSSSSETFNRVTVQITKLQMKKHSGFLLKHFIACAWHILASLQLARRLPRWICHGTAAKRLTLWKLTQSCCKRSQLANACSVYTLDVSNQLHGGDRGPQPGAFGLRTCRMTYLPWNPPCCWPTSKPLTPAVSQVLL